MYIGIRMSRTKATPKIKITIVAEGPILPGSVSTEFSHSSDWRESSWMLSSEDVARAVCDLVRYPDRAIPSRLDLRPSRPPKK